MRYGAIVRDLYTAAMSRPEESFLLKVRLRNLVPWGCPLFIAAYNGDVEGLKAIVRRRRGGGLNDQTNDFGTTALAVSVPPLAWRQSLDVSHTNLTLIRCSAL